MTIYSRAGGAPTGMASRLVRVAGAPATAKAVHVRVAGSPVAAWSSAPPPSFVAATGHKTFAATNTVPALSNVQAGDVLLALAGGNNQTATITPPAGLTWTQLADTGSGANVRGRLFVAVATGPLPATTWTWGGSHNHLVSIGAWRNVQAPTEASASAVAATAATVNAPSRTSTKAGALLVCGGFNSDASDTARGFPASMTARYNGGTGAPSGVFADEALGAAGAAGVRAYTIAPGNATGLLALSVVLEPI